MDYFYCLDIKFYDYLKTLFLQIYFFDNILKNKIYNFKNIKNKIINNYLIITEHDHVYTIGSNYDKKDIYVPIFYLKTIINANLYFVNRGGGVTYHGPGQITVYPVFNLENICKDVNQYLRSLESVIIKLLYYYGLYGFRLHKLTGVWIKSDYKIKKIAFIGVKLNRWTSMHGISVNVNTSIRYYDNIFSCNVIDSDCVTSMNKELGYNLDINDVKLKIKFLFEKIFNIRFLSTDINNFFI